MAENFTVVLQGIHLDPDIPYALYVFDVSVNAVFSIITIMGNTLIMVALWKIPLSKLRKVFKAFLFNLALADLCVGLIVQPLYISSVLTAMSGYPNSSRILGTIFYLGNWYFPNISVSFLTAIAIDRLLALHFGVRYNNLVTFKKVVMVLVFQWILKIAETLLIIFDYRIYNIEANVGLGLCLSLITFCYLKIYLTLRRHDSTVREMFPFQNRQGTCQRELRTVKISHFNMMRYKRSVYNLLYLYAAFVLCYLPPFCILIVIQARRVDKAANIARFLGATLIFVNSSLNPILYCWKIREIRREVLRMLSDVFCSCK